MRAFDPIALLVAGLLAIPSGAADLRVHVVDGRGNPVADAIVWPGAVPAKPPAPRNVEIIQKDRQFSPEVTVIPVGSTVSFPNRDSVQHHVYSFSPVKKFDIPLYIGESPKSIRFAAPGVVVLGCNIHDWMAAYVLVLDGAKFARTNDAGLATVPAPGPARLWIWHPRLRGKPLEIEATPGAVTEVKLALKPAFRRTPPESDGGGYR